MSGSFKMNPQIFYCPQSFSGGGLYSSKNGLLLWSVVGYFYEVWLQIWCKLVTLFDSYSYDGVSAAIGVQHTEVPNLGVACDAFWRVVSAGIWVIHTGAKSGGALVTLFGGYSCDGVSAGIWVIHTGAKSGGELVTLFGGYSYDGVSLVCLLYTSPSPRDATLSRMPSSA